MLVLTQQGPVFIGDAVTADLTWAGFSAWRPCASGELVLTDIDMGAYLISHQAAALWQAACELAGLPRDDISSSWTWH